jgi:hypothetical protein
MFRIIHIKIQTLLFWEKANSKEKVIEYILDTEYSGIFKNPPHAHKRGRTEAPNRLRLNQIRQSYHPNINMCYSNSARNIIRRTSVQTKGSAQQSFSVDSIVESIKRVIKTIEEN